MKSVSIQSVVIKSNNNKMEEHESDTETNCNWYAWYSHKRIGTGTVGLRHKRISRDLPNNSIIKISCNIPIHEYVK